MTTSGSSLFDDDEPFGAAPDSVERNIDEMSSIMQQRRRANAAVVSKNDTERYLVVVYPSRAARERALNALERGE